MINRVVLVGRVTRDVEVRKTQTGLSVASFTFACNRRQAKDAPERQADFINCVAWRGTADFLGAYCKKGTLVGVEGRIQTRNYEANDGRRVYVTEVLCDSVQLLESRSATASRMNEDTMQFTSIDSSGYEPDSDFSDYSSDLSVDLTSEDLPF